MSGTDKWFLPILAVGTVLGVLLMAYFSWPNPNPPAETVKIFVPAAPIPVATELDQMRAAYLEETATELTLEQLQESDLVVAQISIKNRGWEYCPCLFYLAKTGTGEVVYSYLQIINLLPSNFPLFRFYSWHSPRLDLARGTLTVDQEVSSRLLTFNLMFGGMLGALVSIVFWLGLVLFCFLLGLFNRRKRVEVQVQRR